MYKQERIFLQGSEFTGECPYCNKPCGLEPVGYLYNPDMELCGLEVLCAEHCEEEFTIFHLTDKQIKDFDIAN
jgi:hypothetical protein